MAVSVFKTFIAGEILSASDLNSSFTQITTNGQDLGWPATKAKDMDGNELVLDGDADSSLTVDTDDRLDVKLAGFDAFRFDGTTATIVNAIDFYASDAGNPVSIQARGSDTDITINLVPKGAGTVQSNGSDILISPLVADLQMDGNNLTDSNGNEIFTYAETASAVNQVHLVNSATGNSPGVGSEGEADIGLLLLDSNQNELATFNAVASAVNQVSLTNAATTDPVQITADGETNIDVQIFGKGTGTLQLGDANLVIPDADGSDGQVMATNGAGTLSFVTRNFIQFASTQSGALDTTSTAIPADDSIPQNDEGKEAFTVAITPTNTNNTLIIDVTLWIASSTSGAKVSGALFQDTTVNALAGMVQEAGGANSQVNLHFRHIMTAGTTSSTTFKVRFGASAGTATLNGSSEARQFGGVAASSVSVTEVA